MLKGKGFTLSLLADVGLFKVDVLGVLVWGIDVGVLEVADRSVSGECGGIVGIICSSGGLRGSDGCSDVELEANDVELWFAFNSRSLASIAAILSLVLKINHSQDWPTY